MTNTENGIQTLNQKNKTDQKNIVIPVEVMDDDESKVTIQDTDLLCFNVGDFEGTCCEFRLYGLPWNEKVTYNYCGANCGANLEYGGGTPVNDLDRCCVSHDQCYNQQTGYPDRCSCDQELIDCASQQDDAGASRVANAFRAKMLATGC